MSSTVFKIQQMKQNVQKKVLMNGVDPWPQGEKGRQIHVEKLFFHVIGKHKFKQSILSNDNIMTHITEPQE